MSIAGLLFRTICSHGDRKRDKGLTTPADVERFDNIIYGRSSQLLDLYRPKKTFQKLPLIISIHGGGWVYGDKDVYQFYCMDLARRGVAVLNFTYRLAPKHKFPAQLEDVDDAVHWALEHGDEYDFDPHHVFLVGDSAGAHLAALYACICTNASYAHHFHTVCPPTGFVPTGLGLHCGLYDLSSMDENAKMLTSMLHDVFGKRTPDLDALVSPSKHIISGFPPVFFMSANKDFLLHQAPVLEKVLAEHKIPYLYKLYGTEADPRGHVFHCNIRDEIAAQCNNDLCDYFRSVLAPTERN